MKLAFEWDPDKAARNAAKHGVEFAEASTVFLDPAVRDRVEWRYGEERWVVMGRSVRGRILVVCFTEREERVRIISARPATRRERREHAG